VSTKVTDFLIEYCRAFRKAGADSIALMEPRTGILSPTLAEEFSEPYVKKLIDAVKSDDFLFIYHNCGIDSILCVGADAYHFVTAIGMKEMMKVCPADTVIMGNIDLAGEFYGGIPELFRKVTLETKYPIL